MARVLLYPDHSAKVQASTLPYPDMKWEIKPGQVSGVLPPSVRYYNPATGSIVLERPPTRVLIEYINLRKMDAYKAKNKPREQYEIPIPWQTYYAVGYNKRIVATHVGFHSRSISTGTEALKHFPLPNLNDTLVCGAQVQSVQTGITGALESINSFWHSGFNVNASGAQPPRGYVSGRYNHLFNTRSWSKYFHRLEKLSVEEVLEYLDNLNTVATFSGMIDGYIRTPQSSYQSMRQFINSLNSL